VGANGSDVHTESSGNGAGADVFRASEDNPGSNTLEVDAANLGLAGSDELDAMDAFDPRSPYLTQLTTDAYFTVDLTEADLETGHIYHSDLAGNATLYRDASTLGLTDTDIIDGLVLDVANNVALFSLASGSTSIGGFSGADVFYTDFSGSFSLLVSHSDLGLLASDDIDGLEIDVPLPATGLLMLVGLAALRRCIAA